MRVLFFLIPDVAIEVVARLVGYFVRLVRPGFEGSAENDVRGFFWGLRLGARRLRIGRHVTFEGWNHISVGDGVTINLGCSVVAGPLGHVSIGPRTRISRHCVLSGVGGLEIGADCLFSSNVVIYSASNAPDEGKVATEAETKREKVRIGDGTFIGMAAGVVPGVTIGSRCVIGAGSVVMRDVPDNTFALGYPARNVRTAQAGTEAGADHA